MPQLQDASREAKAEVKASVESLNLDQRRGSSNAFLSSEERARKETNAGTNIRWERRKADSSRPRNSSLGLADGWPSLEKCLVRATKLISTVGVSGTSAALTEYI